MDTTTKTVKNARPGPGRTTNEQSDFGPQGAIMKQWLVIGLETEIAWPTEDVTTCYKGWDITLRPETDSLAPSLVIPFEPPRTREQAVCLAMEFLSALAWVENRAAEATILTGGSAIIGVGKGPAGRMTNPSFRIEYLPEPSSDKAQLALALYREALNVNSTPYKFLGFYKIINMLQRAGFEQKAWINATVGLLEDFDAKKRLAALRQSEADIGEYLYVSGRCAVAHAFDDPVVDPDNPEDLSRLAADLRLMKALAEFAIEHEFGVKSLRTVWREHLYELDGFRALFCPEAVSRLKQKGNVPTSDLRPLPKLSIRLNGHPPFAALEGLVAELIEARDGRILVHCTSSDGLVQTGLCLNFADERLEFDPVNSTQIMDDGSPTAMRYAADLHRFTKCWLANGELEVWDAEEIRRLGRCRPFIPPANLNPRRIMEEFDAAITRFEAEALRRKAQGSAGSTDAFAT